MEMRGKPVFLAKFDQQHRDITMNMARIHNDERYSREAN